MKTKMLSVTLLHTVDLRSPSTFPLVMRSVDSGLLDMKLAMEVCFFFIAKEKIELWVPVSKANTFALFDDTIELRSKICLITVLN